VTDVMAGSATTSGAGVLHPARLERAAGLTRHACDPALSRWVEWYWRLTWDLPDGTGYTSHTLPHPASNLSVELGATRPEVGADPVVVTGVVTRRFDVTLTGSGLVVAAKFRPGGLAALTGSSARPLRDRVVPATSLLPVAALAPLYAVDTHTGPGEGVAALDEALLAVTGDTEDDPRYDRMLAIVAELLADRSLTQVSHLEERYGQSARSLQRLFLHYLGVGPKWVILRYRIHDAVTDLDAGFAGPLADLAASLGWYDQAHFIRDFTGLIGQTPGDYRRGLAPVSPNRPVSPPARTPGTGPARRW
jgi:AraC-like DNA-binding protein